MRRAVPFGLAGAALVIAGGGAFLLNDNDDSPPPIQFTAGGSSEYFRESGVRQTSLDVSRSADRKLLAQQTNQQADLRRAALREQQSDAAKRGAELEATRWVLPVVGYRITGTFGSSGGPWSGYSHSGLDFAAPTGTEIVAVAAGTVQEAAYSGDCGNTLAILTDDELLMRYCHMNEIDVEVGDEVSAGEHVGEVGSTGHSTGPHLHLQFEPDAGAASSIDPMPVLQDHGVNP